MKRSRQSLIAESDVFVETTEEGFSWGLNQPKDKLLNSSFESFETF